MKILRLAANPLWRRGRFSPAPLLPPRPLRPLPYLAHSTTASASISTKHFRRNQLAHFHHARRWPDLSEKLSVRPANLSHSGDVRHINSRPHNVFEARACFDERRLRCS